MKTYEFKEGVEILAERLGVTKKQIKEYLVNAGFCWFSNKYNCIYPYKKFCKSQMSGKKLMFRMFYVEISDENEVNYKMTEYGIKYITKHFES